MLDATQFHQIVLAPNATENAFACEVARLASAAGPEGRYWGDGKKSLASSWAQGANKYAYRGRQFDAAWAAGAGVSAPTVACQLKLAGPGANSQSFYRYLHDVLICTLAQCFVPAAAGVRHGCMAAIASGIRQPDWCRGRMLTGPVELRITSDPNAPARDPDHAWIDTASGVIAPTGRSTITWILLAQSGGPFGWWFRPGTLTIRFDQQVHHASGWDFLCATPMAVELDGRPVTEREVLHFLP